MKRERTDPWLKKQLIHSSLILCGLMLITMILGFVISNVYQLRELTRSNQALLHQNIERIDDTLDTINKSMLTLLIDNPSIINYMENDYSAASALSKFDTTRSLQKSIVNIKSVYAPIYSIYVINKETGQALAENGVYALDDVNLMLNMPLPELSKDYVSFGFRELSIQKLDSSPTTIQAVMIARNYPVYSRHLTKGMVLVWIREGDLRAMLAETLLLHSESTITILADDKTMKTFGAKGAIENRRKELADMISDMRASGEDVKTSDGKHYFLQRSSYTGWSYLLEMPKDKELSLLETIRNIFLSAILLYTSLAIALIFRSNKNTIGKVGELASAVQRRIGEDRSDESGSFHYLEGAFGRIIDQTLAMEGVISHYKPMALYKLMDDLLWPGRIKNYDRHLHELKALGLDLFADAYCAIIVKLKHQEHSQEADLAIAKVIKKSLPASMRSAELARREEGVISIVLFENSNEGQNRLALRHLCRSIAMESEKQGLDLYVGVGKIYPLPINLPASYKTAAEAMKYRLFSPERCVLIYEDIWNDYAAEPGSGTQADNILHLLRQGDTSSEFLQAIESYYIALSTQKLRLPVFHMAVLEMISKGIRVGLDMGVKSEILYEKDLFSILESSADWEELIAITKELFLFISRQISLRRNRRSLSNLGAQMVTYINEHFADSDLSLTKIGGYMNVSESYASRIIKEYAGINFQEYLTQIRIERAKQALKNTDMSVAQVGMQVGYISNHSFIRLFKKLEGMSPGQWRKQREENRRES